jgi:hypothetical protein
MKKIFLILAAGFTSAGAIVTTANGQQSADTGQNARDTLIYAKNERASKAMYDVAPVNKSGAVNAAGLENNPGENTATINKRAVKNFNTAFRSAETVKWFTIPDGFIVYCTIDGNSNKVYYDKRGNWRFTTQQYNEKRLPAAVRATVKRTYYDFSIYNVLEIRAAENKIFYLVYIKDETSFKTLRVYDGEMDVLESTDYIH